MAYATGKYAIAQCDRCAFEYPLNQLKKEWNGLKTCPECWEPKHPQLGPFRKVVDPEALKNARPDRKEPLVVTVGMPTVLQPNNRPASAFGQVGFVTVVTT